MNKVFFLGAVMLAFAGFVASEVIENNKCTGRRDGNTLSTVHEISVTPCEDATGEQSSPCRLQRGPNSNANITIRFTPQQKHKRMKASIVWASGSIELPFRGMQSNGCRSLLNGRCPTTPNEEIVWSAAIPLLPSFPANSYPLKVKIMDGSKFVVCQSFNIKLL